MSVYTLKQVNEEVSLCSFNHFGTDFHSHDFLELAYIEEGSVMHTIDKEVTMLKKGDYFIIDYDTLHKYKSTDNGTIKIINCLFLPSFLDKSLKNCRKFSEVTGNYLIRINKSMLTRNPSNTAFNDEDGKIYKILKNMLNEYNTKNNGYVEILRANLIEILVITLRKIMSTDVTENGDSITQSIKDYVSKYFNETVSLTEISSKLNYSVPYLSIKFKKDTGMNFNEYVQKYRIEQSCVMLKNSNKKIYDISRAVGYNDLKYYNSVFKKLMGMTPYKFRKL